MDCHSNHSVFLRADGSLACWDDAGSRRTLHSFDPTVDASQQVVFGSVFGEIRRKLHKGNMPFPDVCQDCMVFASGACFNPGWAANKEILIFQVEPSIACTLECPGCMTLAERKKRHGPPWNLEMGIFEKYLSDFKRDGVTVRTIDFQGHGEPLINRNVWQMVSLARSHFPDANVSMCTNAHGVFESSQVRSGISEMIFAIDGVDQESFEKNRARGSFEKAYSFMKAFCHGAVAEGRDIKTVWKYILFDCNDSREHLLRAQELASEAGVNELLFVNSQLGLRASKVFSLEDIPAFDSSVVIRMSSYLANFHDVLHSIDKARFALFQLDQNGASANLMFSSNMIRRRFACLSPTDELPEEYQALVYEILDLSADPQFDEQTRLRIKGGLHSLLSKLAISLLEAKNLIIRWKSEEVVRLATQLASQPNSDNAVM
ncbi:4Fe-4S cluster-binding domain-containing protein [Ruegeria sp. WL0004]|uniref:4Fe-4S cluster-binding domain-containing protein n=1 Tax=Ruegeria marisflavi TaxID=2984152 RepID=A0ABT2WXZ5_9RHOB|nr:4Fe-4S cluster-binding domain-containing protein [Ruegeria sp. WL0004]MCU9840518.1 4Fe-4S cluster-binding domain-containing protein [Ruegeria sp. WL0004]